MTPKVALRLAVTAAIVLAIAIALSPARAQSQRDAAQMQLYIQQLEEQVRLLTGENERLLFELRQLQAQTGTTGGASSDGHIGVVTGGTVNPASNSSAVSGAQMQDLGSLSISADDPRAAPDGQVAESGGGLTGAASGGNANPGSGPIDLSALAGGSDVPAGGANSLANIGSIQPDAGGGTQIAAVSGDAKQAYDVAYGYILTGDYGVAEQHFQIWLESYPDNPQSGDARFWLGEAQFQQGRHREAASNFLALYRANPESRKAPDTLMRLGMSLAALGEKDAACGTFAEVQKKYPDAGGPVLNRVTEEARRARC